MGTIKDRNGRDLTEAEDIKKRWQKTQRRIIRKRSYWPKWARWCDHSPTARYPGVCTQVGLRKHHYEQSYCRWWNSSWTISNLKRWCCESATLYLSANLENSTMATGLESSVFIPIPKKDNAKECSNYQTIAFISHVTKVMLKILQVKLQQYVNHELLKVQAGFI